jgi:hypothetical protein
VGLVKGNFSFSNQLMIRIIYLEIQCETPNGVIIMCFHSHVYPIQECITFFHCLVLIIINWSNLNKLIVQIKLNPCTNNWMLFMSSNHVALSHSGWVDSSSISIFKIHYFCSKFDWQIWRENSWCLHQSDNNMRKMIHA